MRFRRNLERMGEVLAYELSKELEYQEKVVKTPLGETTVAQIVDEPVIAAVLRAGLPLHQGLLNYFDQAENAFISAYRKHDKDGGFIIKVEYISCPSVEGKVVLLADPMLATGNSMFLAYEALRKFGTPKHIHVVAAIGSAEGVEFIKRQFPKNTTLWIGAIDDELTVQSYIVPGLGDAGDLAFGKKVQD